MVFTVWNPHKLIVKYWPVWFVSVLSYSNTPQCKKICTTMFEPSLQRACAFHFATNITFTSLSHVLPCDTRLIGCRSVNR